MVGFIISRRKYQVIWKILKLVFIIAKAKIVVSMCVEGMYGMDCGDRDGKRMVYPNCAVLQIGKFEIA